MSITTDVHDYWNQQSCGTDRTEAEKHSLQYFEEIRAFRYKYEPFIPEFAQFARWQGKKVLEVGVGAGTDFTEFARAGAILSGVDLTEEGIENASKRIALYGLPPADLRVCNAEHLPFDDNTFDLVYSWGVIHHADNTPQCLREIARVCKPGGAVKIMWYSLNSLYAWEIALAHGMLDRRKAAWLHQESLGTKVYNETESRQIVANCGLIVDKITYDEQIVRRESRLGLIRQFLQRALPKKYRYYMMLDMHKPSPVSR